MRSCTTAYASRPVRGSVSPTASSAEAQRLAPRRAISSAGMQPSKYGTASNSCAVRCRPAVSASMNASYCSRDIGQLRYAPSLSPSIVSLP
jgi:hypothetical protein